MKKLTLLSSFLLVLGNFIVAETCNVQNPVIPFHPSTQTQNRFAVSGMVEESKLVSLIGQNPQSSNDIRTVIDHGFSSLVVARFEKDTGSIDSTFNSTGSTPGELVIQPTDLQSQGVALFSTNETALIPVSVHPRSGGGYYVFATSRWNQYQQSKFLVVALTAAGEIDTTFNATGPSANNGGAVTFANTAFLNAYSNAGGNGKAMLQVSSIKFVGNNKALVAGTIVEDPDATHSVPASPSNVSKGFLGALDLINVNWQFSPTVLANGTTAHSITIDHTDGSDLNDIDTGDKIYVAGGKSTGAFVRRYIANNSNNVFNLDITFNQTYTWADPDADPAGDNNGGEYVYESVGSIARDIVMHQDGVVVAIAEPVEVEPILKESITVLKLRKVEQIIEGEQEVTLLDTSFANNGIRTYYFDPMPQMTPLFFMPPYPEFEFENKRFTLQLGAQNEIFVTGTLTVDALPFIYKLDANGQEVNYTKNFKHSVNANNDLVQSLVDSPVMYPVVGQGWIGSIHAAYFAVISHTDNYVYLFGTQGTVDRNVDKSDPLVKELSTTDTIKRVTVGGLSIEADLHRVRMNALYSEQEIQVQIMDNLKDEDGSLPDATSHDDEAEYLTNVVNKNSNVRFCNFRLYSNPVRYETTGQKNLEIYGTVELLSQSQSSGSPDIREVVALYSGDDLSFTIGGGGVDGDFRLHDNSENILDESHRPTVSNGGILAGTLIGTASDGTQLLFTIKSLELVDAEVIAVATEVTGQAHIALQNLYDETVNGYTLSIDNEYLQETASLDVYFDPATDHTQDSAVASPHTMQLREIKLDMLETQSDPTMSDHDNDIETKERGAKYVFGYAKIWSSEFSANEDDLIVFPLHGQIVVSMTNNKIDGTIHSGDIMNPDLASGSYVQGRSQFGRLSIALHDGSLHNTNPLDHVQIRDTATVEFQADLELEYAAVNTSECLSKLIIKESPFSNERNVSQHFTINAEDISIEAAPIQRRIKEKGLHYCKITAYVPIVWDNVGKDDALQLEREVTTVPVGGRLAFIVNQDGSINKPKSCILHGYLTDPKHGTVTVRARVTNFSLVDIT